MTDDNEQRTVATAAEFSGDVLKLAHEIVRLHRVIDEKVADLEYDSDLLDALDAAGVNVEGGGGEPFRINVDAHLPGPLSVPGIRAAANTCELLGRTEMARRLRAEATKRERARS